jgi:hypothetical protein
VYDPQADQTDGYMHAISDGKVDGNTISFSYIGETKHDSGNSTAIRELFRGTISGDTIHLTYQPDGGIHPVEFTANRIMQAGR